MVHKDKHFYVYDLTNLWFILNFYSFLLRLRNFIECCQIRRILVYFIAVAKAYFHEQTGIQRHKPGKSAIHEIIYYSNTQKCVHFISLKLVWEHKKSFILRNFVFLFIYGYKKNSAFWL